MKPLPLKRADRNIDIKNDVEQSLPRPGEIALFFAKQICRSARFFAAVLIVAGAVLTGCENERADIERIIINENYPNEVSENVTLYYSDSAKVKVKLKADRFESYYRGEETYLEFTRGIDVEFYSDSGTVSSTIKANYAKYYPEKEIMEARDDVEVVNVDGDILNTEQLLWTQRDKQITSDAFVKITTEDEIIYGNGLVSNEDFSKYRINDIKGVINVKDKDEEKVIERENELDEELQ